MLKRLWTLFIRDLKVNTREAIPVIVIVFPLLFAVAILFISPGIHDTTVQVAMVDGTDDDRAAYFDQFAHVHLLRDRKAVEDRVLRRDHTIGIIVDEKEMTLLAEGNEPDSIVDYAKLINYLYDTGATIDNTHSEIIEFGRTITPIKKIMVNALLLMISVLSGMLIALNIIEEKTDRTISAVHVTPVSRWLFIFGKSLIGTVFAVVISISCLLITGFGQINLAQAVLVIASLTVLSLLIGFIQGIQGTDVMEAAGSVKLMFLPLAGSIIAYELLADKWHPFLYWSPFFWAYRANDMILSQDGDWFQMLIYVGAIVLICLVVFVVLAPRIHKGLQMHN
ncbi:MAG: ABC transporter permease [Clostridiaceae bacterium]|jgi:ABC-type multidrug transport system permease subunit|nr:ABC transporter permease [Eubacteriales bacterium]NLV48866.1 ABC transporter permease [Clostridiaceae bacterium]